MMPLGHVHCHGYNPETEGATLEYIPTRLDRKKLNKKPVVTDFISAIGAFESCGRRGCDFKKVTKSD